MIALAALLLVEQFDTAVDLGDDGRLLRPAGLEQLGHARQTAGDVLRSADLARRLGQEGAGGDLLAFLDFDAGPLGDVVEVENLAFAVFDDDLRVQVALVLDDRAADVAGGVRLDLASSRLRRCPRSGTLPPTSARIGMLCGSHSQRTWPAVDVWPSSTISTAPLGTSYFSSSRSLASRIVDFTVAGQSTTFLPSVVDHAANADELDAALALAS